jgi:uncharacterized protein (TIGR02680 family)
MSERWVLNRAGIVNVYQYADEILCFGGGRLLLRGVNGSGKSTAMNMLLPFLLDGDTRRIDAAGEQSGVLKSWMLSGRDDAQPIGYLWIEFANGGEFLTCGCGIRANRSSDTVSTWWWITPRRPAIDLDLVQDGRPLSAEGLRAVIGAESVFRQEDRRAYREEVRRRLYGGAEIDQHIRLLHVVRSPRVGDRIDQDLPSYLHDALPHLSEAALSDAAQPLDDLEEHRHNVAELARTSSALTAIHEVYAGYCRSELRRRADRAHELAEAADRSRRAVSAAAADLRQADAKFAAAGAAVRELEARLSELRVEIRSLHDLPAYQEGRQLEDLRNHVKGQADAAQAAQHELDRRRAQESAFRQDVVNAAHSSRQDHGQLASVLRDLSNEILTAGLAAVGPDLPALVAETVGGEVGVEAPEPFPADAARVRLGEIRAAAEHRRGDLGEVRKEIRSVAAAAARLEAALRDLQVAQDELLARREALAVRTADLDRAVTAWRDALTRWSVELGSQLAASGLPPPDDVELQARLADRRIEVRAALRAGADALVAHREGVVATAAAALEQQENQVEKTTADLAELDAMTLPEPPAQPWQRAGRGPTLAELVDFVDGEDEPVRASIEAALEAAGLLTAEVRTDGTLALEDGLLIGVPQSAVANPLSRHLVANDGADYVVTRILDSISTDPSDLGREGTTVVTRDGRFRTGTLAGRHAKNRAEHIGLTARKQRLERLRAEARSQLEEARQALDHLRADLVSAAVSRDEAAALRDRLPPDEPVAAAILALQIAAETAAAAETRVADRRTTAGLADEAHAEAVDKCRRVATNLGLHADEDALETVSAAITAAVERVLAADHALTALQRSVTGWRQAVERWRGSRDLLAEGEQTAAEGHNRLKLLRTRLETLQDRFGAAYEEIRAQIQNGESQADKAERELDDGRKEQLACSAAHVRAASELEVKRGAAEEDAARALAAIPHLKRALAVPGLAASVSTDPSWAAQTVEESVGGLRNLAASVRANAGTGDRREVTADGVRQSLRQRRDSLGAGWDAEDRQPDESIPMTIEINGPEGRHPLADAVSVVGARLAELSSLLSSEQDNALRNLMQGLVAREVAEKLHAAEDLVKRMNRRLDAISTAHGIGVSIRWKRRDDLDPDRSAMVSLLAKRPDLRTEEEDVRLRETLSTQLEYARRENPDTSYSELIGRLLDYSTWYEIVLMLRRPGRPNERLSRRTPLSEGEKKIVSYLPLFAAVAASCDSLGDVAPDAPRFLLLDDAFAKVSEDNHPKLFGLLVELDLDFIATSERLWGTYATVPELAITEVIRDAGLGVVVLEHSRWDGVARASVP